MTCPYNFLYILSPGISFVPKEIGEHLVNIKKNGRHIPSSPISVMINQSEIGDASRVRVTGQGLSEARTFEPAEFIIDTRDAGKWECGQRKYISGVYLSALIWYFYC